MYIPVGRPTWINVNLDIKKVPIKMISVPQTHTVYKQDDMVGLP